MGLHLSQIQSIGPSSAKPDPRPDLVQAAQGALSLPPRRPGRPMQLPGSPATRIRHVQRPHRSRPRTRHPTRRRARSRDGTAGSRSRTAARTAPSPGGTAASRWARGARRALPSKPRSSTAPRPRCARSQPPPPTARAGSRPRPPPRPCTGRPPARRWAAQTARRRSRRAPRRAGSRRHGRGRRRWPRRSRGRIPCPTAPRRASPAGSPGGGSAPAACAPSPRPGSRKPPPPTPRWGPSGPAAPAARRSRPLPRHLQGFGHQGLVCLHSRLVLAARQMRQTGGAQFKATARTRANMPTRPGGALDSSLPLVDGHGAVRIGVTAN